MAHLVEPLIEEPVHRPSCRLFDGDPELSCLDRLVSVLLQVMIDRAPPVRLSQRLAQHVQYRPTALIGIHIEQLVLIGIILSDNRTAIPVRPGVVISILVSLDIQIEEVVMAQVVFIPQPLKVRS